MYYFIVNEHSGMVRRNWHSLNANLRERGIKYKAYKTEGHNHAKRLVGKICNRDPKEDNDIKIVAVGGDGTINEVINGISDFEKVKFGVIPLGSANDFAKGLGLSKDPMKNLETILNSDGETPVDIGMVETDDGVKTYFGISTGMGLDALVCKKVLDSKLKDVLNSLKLGHLSYKALTVTSIFEKEDIKANISIDGEPFETDKLIFFAAMNMPIEGGGVPMAPKATATDGVLTACVAHSAGIIKIMTLLPKLIASKHENLEQIYLKDFNQVEITTDRPVHMHMDGEYCGEVTHLKIKCIPKVLRFLM